MMYLPLHNYPFCLSAKSTLMPAYMQLFICLQFTRRHHCRRCGRVVCAACSSRTAPVGGRSVRVCDECYESMFKSRDTSTSPGGRTRSQRDIAGRRSISLETDVVVVLLLLCTILLVSSIGGAKGMQLAIFSFFFHFVIYYHIYKLCYTCILL